MIKAKNGSAVKRRVSYFGILHTGIARDVYSFSLGEEQEGFRRCFGMRFRYQATNQSADEVKDHGDDITHLKPDGWSLEKYIHLLRLSQSWFPLAK